jgi:hypothetical protein
MKRWLAAFILVSMVCSGAGAAGKGPEINLIDNKLSVNAEGVSLGRLLQLVDMATGMKSKVPPELANRNISVKFSGLTVADAVRKIFQGQPFDYVLIGGQGVVVTAVSQTASGGESLPPYNPPPAAQSIEQPFIQEFPTSPVVQAPPFQQQQAQPAMVQTPFGPIPNPRAQQGQPNAIQTNAPQQNSLFPQIGQPIGQPQTVPGFPGSQPGNPFGTPSTFGTTNPGTNPNNGLFGTVPVFGTPASPPR